MLGLSFFGLRRAYFSGAGLFGVGTFLRIRCCCVNLMLDNQPPNSQISEDSRFQTCYTTSVLYQTAMAEPSSAVAAAIANATANAAKRLREEGEAAKNRLLDQQFHISRYADPLVPRKTSDPQFWPKDVTPEMEQRWLAMIKEHQSV
ncbi:hypothetical protein GGI43DRAFT_19207 [Trichoderma evansii]